MQHDSGCNEQSINLKNSPVSARGHVPLHYHATTTTSTTSITTTPVRSQLAAFLPTPSGHSTFASLATSANVQPTRWYILHAHNFTIFFVKESNRILAFIDKF
ncbi:hypothetical protein ONE63_003974 [Megalurothrips usitatus]|uniref:Uncharacterized protein n=1 Tax=Megalurothrips usitatus TaxID=439358 RepID=A0AAV7X851_9NEOP|nr:hypothetical protein ONE63_003974 [Megalurothrips usitatus]